MNNKKIILIIFFVLLLVGGIYFGYTFLIGEKTFLKKETSLEKEIPLTPSKIKIGDEEALFSGFGARIYEAVENPVKNQMPETNPFSSVEINPFKAGYKNPFD